MTPFDQQWIAALVLMVMALFVSAGLPIPPQWRRRFKIAAISVFIFALVVVLVKIAAWLSIAGR